MALFRVKGQPPSSGHQVYEKAICSASPDEDAAGEDKVRVLGLFDFVFRIYSIKRNNTSDDKR